MKTISIVIGLYKSEKTIENVISEIKSIFISSEYFDYELILVDDHSPDNVYEVVKNLAVTNKKIKIIHLAKNVGQTNAVMEGYRYVTGEYVVEMDDDLQMPAKEILRMIEQLEKGGYDVVFARYREQKQSLFRRFCSAVNNKMTEIMIGKPPHIRVNSFFVMRKFVAQKCVEYSNNYPYLYGIIFAVTNNVANLEVEHRPRAYGKSNYTFGKLFGLWLNGFLNFSVRPLRLAIQIGGVTVFVSLIAAVALVLQRILSGTQSIGWTSIMVTIIFFSGVQLISLGILGEYIGRLYISNSGIPRVTVKETVNCEDSSDNCAKTENHIE